MPQTPRSVLPGSSWDGSWQAIQTAADQLSQADIPGGAKDEVAGSMAKAMKAALVPMHATQMAHIVMRQALGQALDVFCAAAEAQAAISRTPPKPSAKASASTKKVSTSTSIHIVAQQAYSNAGPERLQQVPRTSLEMVMGDA